jgi:hypothetical protein
MAAGNATSITVKPSRGLQLWLAYQRSPSWKRLCVLSSLPATDVLDALALTRQGGQGHQKYFDRSLFDSVEL